MMSPVMQIIVGLVFVLMVLLSTTYFFSAPKQPGLHDNEDDYVGGQTYVVPIVQGVMPFSEGELSIQTANSASAQYVHLPRSNNMAGGAQYSYSFWLSRSNLSSANAANKVIFMRGINRQMQVVTPGKADASGPLNVANKKYGIASYNPSETIVKAPLIRFGSDPSTGVNQLIVEFNSLQQYNQSITITPDILANSVTDYVLVVITFQDMVDMYGYPNGVLFRAFVNNTEVVNTTVATDALRLSDAPLYIYPTMGPSDTSDMRQTLTGGIADLTYYNYSLTQSDITMIYNKGYDTSTYKTPADRANAGAKAQYYRLSLQSELEQI